MLLLGASCSHGSFPTYFTRDLSLSSTAISSFLLPRSPSCGYILNLGLPIPGLNRLSVHIVFFFSLLTCTLRDFVRVDAPSSIGLLDFVAVRFVHLWYHNTVPHCECKLLPSRYVNGQHGSDPQSCSGLSDDQRPREPANMFDRVQVHIKGVLSALSLTLWSG
jgi:hypothetical protein